MAQRLAALAIGVGMNQIVEAFSFGEIELAVLEGAPREFPGLGRPQTYECFRLNCERSRAALMRVLNVLRDDDRRVVGYGATSKSATVTNYCGITPEHVAFIADTTPIKQGKLSPGAHIPVRPPEAFSRPYPDCAVLFAWNHGAEIRAKEQAFIAGGGRFITYVPDVRIAS